MLRGWKTDCETRFRENLTRGMASIGFAELETVTQALVNNGAPASDSLTVIPPQEKMARKLGLGTKQEIVVWAVRNGLLDD